VSNLAAPWTAAYQAPPSMGFSRQEYQSGWCSHSAPKHRRGWHPKHVCVTPWALYDSLCLPHWTPLSALFSMLPLKLSPDGILFSQTHREPFGSHQAPIEEGKMLHQSIRTARGTWWATGFLTTLQSTPLSINCSVLCSIIIQAHTSQVVQNPFS